MSYTFPTLGAAIAVAGLEKLFRHGGYDTMLRELGWSRNAWQAASAVETAGGLLMLPAATRRLGGVLVAAASVALLGSEVSHRDARLAVPRALILMAGIAAVWATRRRPA